MPELARTIEVRRIGEEFTLHIDGEQFPWFTSGGVHVDTKRDDMPMVTLSIPADRVTVLNTVDGQT